MLETEGVRGYHFKLMAADFMLQQELRPAKNQACFHSILSFHPKEHPPDEMMTEIAKKYLEEIGIKDTQYAITKHTDKEHPHLHIIANLIDNKGKVINDSWIGYRAKKAAQDLTQKYRLIPATKKNLAQTHLESLSQSEANRYKIYQAIMENLPHCKSLEELEKRLKKQKIEVQYKYKGQTKEKQGISFGIGKDCFKGSKVDRKFSLGNLQKTFAQKQNQKEKKKENLKETISIRKKSLTNSDNLQSEKPIETEIKTVKEAAKDIAKEAADLFAELMKPEGNEEEVPYEWSERARKKRKKRRLKDQNSGLRH